MNFNKKVISESEIKFGWLPFFHSFAALKILLILV